VPRKYLPSFDFQPSIKLTNTGEQFDLSKLRVVTSTGAVLSEDMFKWFYETGFPPEAQLISMSGGTDIAGCCAYYVSVGILLG
jgi:acyl-coenzyme A synthetase/AMP-(fatty) acid ligase